YYKENKEIVLSMEYPENYESDVGYAFGHGPGKTDEQGNPKLERARPDKVVLLRMWHVEDKRMVAAVLDSSPVKKKLSRICSNPEFGLVEEKNGALVSNFYLEFFHDGRPANKSLTYQVDGHLRPTQNPEVMKAAALPWFPENFFLGLNPFEEPAQPPKNAGKPEMPAVVYDDNGSEVEVNPRTPQEENW
ncbi:MAG: hypothetical protein WBM08_05655, partial [Prochlorococcaceae cyanobacterium]